MLKSEVREFLGLLRKIEAENTPGNYLDRSYLQPAIAYYEALL